MKKLSLNRKRENVVILREPVQDVPTYKEISHRRIYTEAQAREFDAMLQRRIERRLSDDIDLRVFQALQDRITAYEILPGAVEPEELARLRKQLAQVQAALIARGHVSPDFTI